MNKFFLYLLGIIVGVIETIFINFVLNKFESFENPLIDIAVKLAVIILLLFFTSKIFKKVNEYFAKGILISIFVMIILVILFIIYLMSGAGGPLIPFL